MIGIKAIASYIPEQRIMNLDVGKRFGVDETFVKEKIGVLKRSLKSPEESTSDMCFKAFKRLVEKTSINLKEIDCLVVVTQNPDYKIPHTSAIVHGKLNLGEHVAAFDISLGCSGYVYALSIVKSFMQENNLRFGLLFTADPYSDIVDENDKNTSLLFGDAATVTLMGENGRYDLGKFSFGTSGENYKSLMCEDAKLSMDGREVFNFTARYVPADVKTTLERNQLGLDDVDLFLFHQGSKFIVDTVRKRLGLNLEKAPFHMLHYGNTVSSSIPLMLEEELEAEERNTILISGFGLGFSWASTVLFKNSPHKE